MKRWTEKKVYNHQLNLITHVIPNAFSCQLNVRFVVGSFKRAHTQIRHSLGWDANLYIRQFFVCLIETTNNNNMAKKSAENWSFALAKTVYCYLSGCQNRGKKWTNHWAWLASSSGIKIYQLNKQSERGIFSIFIYKYREKESTMNILVSLISNMKKNSGINNIDIVRNENVNIFLFCFLLFFYYIYPFCNVIYAIYFPSKSVKIADAKRNMEIN